MLSEAKHLRSSSPDPVRKKLTAEIPRPDKPGAQDDNRILTGGS